MGPGHIPSTQSTNTNGERLQKGKQVKGIDWLLV